ncbi:hypothetical protein AVEN_135670-1 [Araneus ventricosus]|uniref:Uncharacterized protein n=1 Tax=Araneus ventricosus TaxID=182803 RepID=A0A4Y2QRK3_ARAVE|nr:hypothetical protein AVEN_135670-1 [Araneus ventricosus]
MGFYFIPASTGEIGPELAHETLESQLPFSLLTANDTFFIIEIPWAQIVISVKPFSPTPYNDYSVQRHLLATFVNKSEPSVSDFYGSQNKDNIEFILPSISIAELFNPGGRASVGGTDMKWTLPTWVVIYPPPHPLL